MYPAWLDLDEREVPREPDTKTASSHLLPGTPCLLVNTPNTERVKITLGVCCPALLSTYADGGPVPVTYQRLEYARHKGTSDGDPPAGGTIYVVSARVQCFPSKAHQRPHRH